MIYTKPFQTFEQQADLLLERGLIADRTELINRLISVNYYRLSGYLYPFRLNDDYFRENTTLDLVWKLYCFDRQLRFLVMDAIERIEVATRTALAYEFAQKYGPFGYTDLSNFSNVRMESKHQKWLEELSKETDRSNEVFIDHFTKKYGDQHKRLPIWMLIEVMSFGKTLTFYNMITNDIQKKVAERFAITDTVLSSWLRTLNTIRNICAHHGRLWNRELRVKPTLPRENKSPHWHHPVSIQNNRIFGILTILKYSLKIIAPTSNWHARLYKLLDTYPDVKLIHLGFPTNWHDSPLWR